MSFTITANPTPLRPLDPGASAQPVEATAWAQGQPPQGGGSSAMTAMAATSGPAAARPAIRRSAHTQSQLKRAMAHLSRDRVDLACIALKKIEPATELSAKIIRLVCASAVHLDDTDEAVRLLEHIVRRDSILRPSLGLSSEGRLLDLHMGEVFTAPACQEEWRFEEGAGLTAATALVLLELHRKRGQLKPGVAVVVGYRGAGVLRQTVSDWVHRQGWDCSAPMWRNGRGQRVGVLLITAPDALHRPADMVVPYSGGARPMDRLRQELERIEATGFSPDMENVVISRVRECLVADGPGATLEVLGASPAATLPMYRLVAFHTFVRPDSGSFTATLDVMEARFGRLPDAEWLHLLAVAAAHRRGAWDLAHRVLATMKQRGVPPGADHLVGLLDSATAPQDIVAARRWYDAQVGQGLARETRERLCKALFRRAAAHAHVHIAQWMREEVVKLRLGADPHVRQSDLIFTARFGEPSAAVRGLTACRRQSGAVDATCVKGIVAALSGRGWRSQAADVIEDSLQHGDGLYAPALGLMSGPEGRPLLNLSCPGVFQRTFPVRLASHTYLPWDEALAIVHLHGRKGTLAPGMHLQVTGAMTAQTRERLLDCLRGFGLGLTPARTHDGVLLPHHEIVALQGPQHSRGGE